MSDLQNKANPLFDSFSALAYEIKGLKDEQKETNKLLKAKNEFDIKTHSLSTKFNLIATFLACCALYVAAVAVYGFDSDLVGYAVHVWHGWTS